MYRVTLHQRLRALVPVHTTAVEQDQLKRAMPAWTIV